MGHPAKNKTTLLVVWISDVFYHSEFSDYYLHLYCYIHNILADLFSGLLQVFLVKLGSLHRTLNSVLYLIYGGCLLACSVFFSVNHNWVQALSIPLLLLACSQDWTCNLQLIVTKKLREPMPITVTPCVLLEVAGLILTASEWHYRNTYHLYPVMFNKIRVSNSSWLNKRCGLKFRVGSQIWQDTPEEGWKVYWLKYKYNNKDEDNGPKTLNDKKTNV